MHWVLCVCVFNSCESIRAFAFVWRATFAIHTSILLQYSLFTVPSLLRAQSHTQSFILYFIFHSAFHVPILIRRNFFFSFLFFNVFPPLCSWCFLARKGGTSSPFLLSPLFRLYFACSCLALFYYTCSELNKSFIFSTMKRAADSHFSGNRNATECK